MGSRNYKGNTISENGWPIVDNLSCQWTTVPGTSPPVSLEIQQGWPLIILRAFAADFNAEVEPLRDADSACFTWENSVNNSNHLGGTGMDLNWNGEDGKTFRYNISEARAYPGNKSRKVRELLDWYEDIVFCGGFWSNGDWMHFQMNGNTFNNPRVADFIKRKIRADGFSTRRGAAPSVLTVPLVQNPNGTWTSPSPAWAHLIQRESSGNPTIVQQIIDVNSGGNEAEGLFQITPATWRAHNGTEFAPSARFATPEQQAIVAARILTRNPSGSDWGAGLPGREDPSQLAAGLVPTAGTSQGEDELSAEAERLIGEIHGALFNQIPSTSIYATPGEGARWKLHELIKNDDGLIHQIYVEASARVGDYDSLQRVALVASGRGVNGSADVVARAQAVLAEIERNTPEILQAFIAKNGAK